MLSKDGDLFILLSLKPKFLTLMCESVNKINWALIQYKDTVLPA